MCPSILKTLAKKSKHYLNELMWIVLISTVQLLHAQDWYEFCSAPVLIWDVDLGKTSVP